MKFITVRDFRTSPAKIWRELPNEQEMIITNNGKPIALLTPLSDTNLESSLSSLRISKAVTSVKLMREMSSQNNNSLLTNKKTIVSPKQFLEKIVL